MELTYEGKKLDDYDKDTLVRLVHDLYVLWKYEQAKNSHVPKRIMAGFGLLPYNGFGV